MASSRAPKINSHRDVMMLWSSRAKLAKSIDEKYPTVAAMWRRGSLSPRVWHAVSKAARQDLGVQVSVATLCDLHGR